MSEPNIKVKNKAVAPLQITAEQILLEAFERKEEPLKVPKQKITDLEELREYQGRKRKEYESSLRHNRLNIGQWQRYALWEIEQREFERARSVFERALDVDSSNVPLWIKYIQAELKERNINHARNLLDRAVTLLPRVDKIWFTYVSVEETLSNISGCRQVFERWMTWKPSSAAWMAYVNMERRYREFDRARDIFQRFTTVHPQPENWIKWARFEQEYGTVENVRDVFTLAVDTMLAAVGDEYLDEKVLVEWAKWESRQREWERARAIFKFGLERLSKSRSTKLYNSYTAFEKQYGDKEGIEDVILSKRRVKYEDQVAEDSYNYDAWFSYLTLVEETNSDVAEIRDIYERAIANLPQQPEKKYWQRYIYLWIRYAVYEELTNNDVERTRQIYQQCINVIPHKKFSFDKIWLLYSKFEIRNGSLQKARKILGQGLGLSGKPKVYREYIEIEKKLKEFDRCRILYEKLLENYPELPQGWIDYAMMEQQLGDDDRARAIFELAISQPEMEMPELVWRKYIDFETEIGEYERARKLFEILVEMTGHVKVWISYAVFEISVPESDEAEDEEEDDEDEEKELEVTEEGKNRARAIFRRAWDSLKQKGFKEERVVLNDAWIEFEETYGTAETVEKVKSQAPSMVKKRKRLDDGSFEEYVDYVFPTDEGDRNYSKFLEAARRWKTQEQNTN
jgi:crooked neck